MILTPNNGHGPTASEPPRRKAGGGGSSRSEGQGGPALKVFAVLETIASQQRPLAIYELAALLGVPKPTMHRIVRQLDSEGLLQREPNRRVYGPGPRLLNFALHTVSSAMQSAPRHAVLEALSGAVGETCNFGMLNGNAIVYLDRVEASWPFGLKFEAGSRVPLHCTSVGKLLLSVQPRRRRDELIRATTLARYTENTITDPEALNRELDEIRKRGYSIDNQEFLAGVVCLAAPVRDSKGVVCAGLAISAPHARMSVDEAILHLPKLLAAAKQLAAHLGQD
ncbi:MAG TPA: IclR family transcriptional regulator [Hyphomicrobiaceae bacterium]|nr:IclR family transcriptional regulator [Hyphomicrobiaceae bacterium]